MKKIYLLILSLGIGLSGFAQDQAANQKSKYVKSSARPIGTTVKKSTATNAAKGQVLWSDDFSADSNWTRNSPVGDSLWKIGTTGPSGGFAILPINSTTAFNNFAIFDSDLYCTFDQIANITTAKPINLSTAPGALLRFEQYYRRYWDSTFVFVSIDRVNWVKFSVNKNLINNEFSAGSDLINPDVVEVNISSVAALQDSVWIRFQFYSPNSLNTTLAGCGYAWMIDDVSISIPPAVDAQLVDAGVPNSGCSLGAAEVITATIVNNGTDTLSGFNVQYAIDNNPPVIEAFAGLILPGQSAIHTFAQTANFSAAADYFVSIYISDLTGDANVGNDSLFAIISNVLPIDVTPFYSQGFEPQEDLQGWTLADVNGDGVSWDLINTFQRSGGFCLRKPGSAANDDDWVFTNCINLSSGKTYNMVFYTKVFDLVAICDIKVAIGTEATPAGMGNVLYTRPAATDTSYLQVIVPITVPTTGLYHIGFNAFASTGTSSIRIDDFSITDGPLGVAGNELKADISVFPNPSAGIANVAIRNTNMENYEITLVDMMGRSVRNMTLNGVVSGDFELNLEGLANGVYTVKVQAGNDFKAEKLILNR
jgi:hypothetical protein